MFSIVYAPIWVGVALIVILIIAGFLSKKTHARNLNERILVGDVVETIDAEGNLVYKNYRDA